MKKRAVSGFGAGSGSAIKCTDPRIRNRTKMSRFRNTKKPCKYTSFTQKINLQLQRSTIRHKQISVVIEFFYNWDPQKIRKKFLLLFQNSAEELQRAGHPDGGIRGSEALRVEGDN